jgi:protein SCO1/2
VAAQRAEHGQADTPDIHGGAFRIVVVLAVALAVLTAVRVTGDAMSPSTPPGGVVITEPSASPEPSIDVAAYLEAEPWVAPPLALSGPAGPVSLAAMAGGPVLVFFGYTHCPDVCPATIGTVGVAIDAYGPEARALFVSVDPERDTLDWLGEFVRFMPPGFEAATGSPQEIRAVADAWGVRYARVETEGAERYQMAHTADVFAVDANGLVRARFPFGTEAPTMTAVLRAIAASPLPPPTASVPTPAGSPYASPGTTARDDLRPVLVSSSVWAGGASPVILTLDAAAAAIVRVQVVAPDGGPVGRAVHAATVEPEGIATPSYVAVVDLPAPGSWRLEITAEEPSGVVRSGTVGVTALDPGGTAPLGRRAPTAHTHTRADVGGDLVQVTTDPLPDPRLSATSTTDALADGRPFVLVVDSIAFRVTPACGQAVVMAKRLLDRWGSVPFIHHEPYRYTVVTREPVIEGSLEDPRLTDVADAWGVGSPPWGVTSMPWIFIVDGDGIVRAKYQGVVGSADIDVVLSLIASEG